MNPSIILKSICGQPFRLWIPGGIQHWCGNLFTTLKSVGKRSVLKPCFHWPRHIMYLLKCYKPTKCFSAPLYSIRLPYPQFSTAISWWLDYDWQFFTVLNRGGTPARRGGEGIPQFARPFPPSFHSHAAISLSQWREREKRLWFSCSSPVQKWSTLAVLAPSCMIKAQGLKTDRTHWRVACCAILPEWGRTKSKPHSSPIKKLKSETRLWFQKAKRA